MAGTPMPWVKLYTEMLDDPKIGRMDMSLRWRFVEMILLAGECDADGLLITGDEPMSIEDMAWRLRCDAKSILEDLKKIQKIGLIDLYDGCWLVCKFRDRQGRPQSEKREQWRDRQKKHRDVTGDTSVTNPPREEKNREEENRQDEEEEISDEPFRILFDAFLDASGISELMLVGHKAVDEITGKWIPSNVTPAEIKGAVKQLQDKGYNITGPWSITNTINMIRSGKKGSANKPLSEKYKLPEDYEEEEYEDDDEPVVDTKWTTFLEQHVKDVRWRNLLEYGGYDGSGKVVIHVPEASMAEAKSRFGSTLSRYYLGNVVLAGVT